VLPVKCNFYIIGNSYTPTTLSESHNYPLDIDSKKNIESPPRNMLHPGMKITLPNIWYTFYTSRNNCC